MIETATSETPLGRDEQAADWCMRLAESELDAAEQRAFDAWLAMPGNREAFDTASLVWRGVETAADMPELIHVRTEALENLRRSNSRRWARGAAGRWRIPAAAAAVLFVAVTIGWMTLRSPAQVYETGVGERRVTVLEDGSQLSLDAATRVEVRMQADRRELRLLAGRARFSVAKDPLRPFSVAAGDKLVVAVGTAFSVELLSRQMRVVLLEGRVEVLEHPPAAAKPHPLVLGAHALTAERALTPGRELVVALDKQTAAVTAVDTSRSLSWEGGQLNFSNEPLTSAVERMNRYSKEKLVLGDPQVASFSINGVFTAGDTAAFIEGVKTYYSIAVARQPGKLVLTSGAAQKINAQGAVPPAD